MCVEDNVLCNPALARGNIKVINWDLSKGWSGQNCHPYLLKMSRINAWKWTNQMYEKNAFKVTTLLNTIAKPSWWIFWQSHQVDVKCVVIVQGLRSTPQQCIDRRHVTTMPDDSVTALMAYTAYLHVKYSRRDKSMGEWMLLCYCHWFRRISVTLVSVHQWDSFSFCVPRSKLP